ncbi:MAG: hypothetical protein K1X88_21030 [Nannocystaceae bacterium]|nr:hypothetical protein [Nannocystaceae bacterium]
MTPATSIMRSTAPGLAGSPQPAETCGGPVSPPLLSSLAVVAVVLASVLDALVLDAVVLDAVVLDAVVLDAVVALVPCEVADPPLLPLSLPSSAAPSSPACGQPLAEDSNTITITLRPMRAMGSR